MTHSSTVPRPFVFTLMPFDSSFEDVYRLGIQPACEKAGAYCERVDEQIFQESILQRIYNQIAKADLIIADLSGRNPNVFYETGYAHALGKPVILLTKSVEDIPFDLKHYPHVIYDGRITDLKRELERRVSWHLEQGTRPQTSIDQIDFYIDQRRAEDGERYSIAATDPLMDDGSFSVQFAIALHNASGRVYQGADEIGFICPSAIRLGQAGDLKEDDPPILLPDDTHLIVFRELPRFMPGSWEVIRFHAFVRVRAYRDGFPMTIRRFTPSGPHDLSITLLPTFQTED